jgi:hypothetical protein
MLPPVDCQKKIVYSFVRIHQSQSAYAVRRLLNGRVSVPEVLGYRIRRYGC